MFSESSLGEEGLGVGDDSFHFGEIGHSMDDSVGSYGLKSVFWTLDSQIIETGKFPIFQNGTF